MQNQQALREAPRPGAPPVSWLDRQLLRELPSEWRFAYLYFAFALMLVLGTALMINPPTISTFVDSVGVDQQPIAQAYLPLVLLPVLLVYNFLCTALKNPAVLVVVVSLAYAAIYVVIAIRSMEGSHIEPSLAWILFYATNTKAVLFPVMFWSVMNDISSTQYSKVAYPALVLAGQLGGLVGSLYATFVSKVGGTTGLLFVQAIALVAVAALVWIACGRASAAAPQEDVEVSLQGVAGAQNGSRDAREQLIAGGASSASGACGRCAAGSKAVGAKLYELVEGIQLILTKPYVAGIFWVACAHLVPRVILDYQGTALINERWPRSVDGHLVPGNKDKQTAFFAWCNLANTVGTAALSIFGLRSMIERGGLVLTLLACPVAMLCSVLIVCAHHDFWTVQVVLVVVNVAQYALNGPSREMLYVRTSKNIKYKAKSWSDMYGNFLQKTVGAMINLHVNREQKSCTPNCFKPIFTGTYTVVWCAFWIFVATLLGMKHARLVKNNETVS